MTRALFWSATAAYLLLVIGFAWNPTPLAQVLAAIGIACAFAQAVMVYGLYRALAFLAICLTVSFGMENLGVATGLPFGHYHFEVGAALPHIGAIPIIVGPLWFGMGYFSWMVARILLNKANAQHSLLKLPALAALVMTAWDLVMDAPNATIAHVWIWHDGGIDFGVPLTNYFGWLLTSWLFFQLFALYLRGHSVQAASPALQLAAILFYAASGLTHVTPWLMGGGGTAADASGRVWHVEEIRAGTVLAFALTMLPITLLALWRLSAGVRRAAIMS